MAFAGLERIGVLKARSGARDAFAQFSDPLLAICPHFAVGLCFIPAAWRQPRMGFELGALSYAGVQFGAR
jgi:hypothetical protein